MKVKDIKGVRLEDIIKDMNEEELERFKKERYEKFIKPLTRLNLKVIQDTNTELQGENKDKNN